MAVNQRIENELAPLLTTLYSTLEEGFFFGEIGRFFQKSFNTDEVQVYRAHETGGAELMSSAGHAITGQIFSPGKSLSGYVIKTKRAYYSNNVQRDPLFCGFENCAGIVAELAVPFLVDGMVIGTLHIRSKNPKNFGQEQVLEVTEIVKLLDRPLLNMKMYLAAKDLNQSLLKKIEEKDTELKRQKEGSGVKRGSHLIDRPIIGSSPQIKDVLEMIKKVAPSTSTVLIQGRSGTGKELVAQKIHVLSLRKEGPYVALNCGALQDTLLESELFGHEKGSFTGAINQKMGLVEMADGGTLFLDEVSELSPAVQTKLLRFLQESEAYRVGGRVPYKVNVRIISATNRDLKKEVDEGRFREDLYYRLNTIKVDVPALKDRGQDIQILAEYFLNHGKNAEEVKTLTPSAMKILMSYEWPGNIRELQNAMERSFIMADGKFIDEGHFPEQILTPKLDETPKIETQQWEDITLGDLEKRHIIHTLDHMGNNKTRTAKLLGITVKTLYNKLHSYGMIEAREMP